MKARENYNDDEIITHPVKKKVAGREIAASVLLKSEVW